MKWKNSSGLFVRLKEDKRLLFTSYCIYCDYINIIILKIIVSRINDLVFLHGLFRLILILHPLL